MVEFDKSRLYRLPWNLYDSPVGWVEITDGCNIACKGCYRTYLETHEGHKSLDEIEREVLFLEKERRVVYISLSGGEPLLHPRLAEVVRLIARRGLGVKMFTNGKGLSAPFLGDLVSAGLNQIAFHIDTFQTRRDEWDRRTEIELNALRQHYVDLCEAHPGLGISFTCMVTRRNLNDMPAVVRWALGNRGKVEGVAFFALRTYDPVADEERPELVNVEREENVTSREIGEALGNAFPGYDVCAYFGGTADARSLKWLFSVAVCSGERFVGSLGPMSMELYQVMNHLIYGRYGVNGQQKRGLWTYAVELTCLLFDRRFHRILIDLAKEPKLLLRSLFLFDVVIVQAHDVTDAGDMDMCDGCPDMTYFNGRLVPSCRLDEFRRYGRFIPHLREG
jgi:MoaA/NifB/PqqE/SkfB family radical SAM enzyme